MPKTLILFILLFFLGSVGYFVSSIFREASDDAGLSTPVSEISFEVQPQPRRAPRLAAPKVKTDQNKAHPVEDHHVEPHEIEVTVRHHDQSPAHGIELILERSESGARAQTQSLGTTNPEGKLSCSFSPAHDEDLNSANSFKLRVRGVFTLPIERQIRRSAIPSTLHFQLPPVGSVSVAFEDSFGNKLRVSGTLGLSHRDRAFSQPGTLGLRRDFDRGEETISLFPVEVAMPLRCDFAAGAQEAIGNARTAGVGPSTAGANSTLQVTLNALPHVARGRIVDREGRPRPGLALETRVTYLSPSGHASFESTRSRTDDEGRFLVILAEPEREEFIEQLGSKGLSTTLHIKAEDARAPSASPEWTLTEIFPARPPGPIDIGDLLLEPLPLIARGRIEDDAGAPLLSQGIGFETFNPNFSRRGEPLHERTQMFWESAPSQDGIFECRGLLEDLDPKFRKMRVVLKSEHYSAESVVFEPGDQDLRLRAERNGMIAGEVQLLPEMLPRDLRLTLISAGEENLDHGTALAVSSSGSFRATNIRPGLYDLVLSTNYRWAVRRFSGIRIAPGSLTKTAAIVLADDLARFELNMEGATTEALQDVSLMISLPGTENHARGVEPRPSGQFIFFHPPGAARLVAGARAHREISFTAVPGKNTVRLELIARRSIQVTDAASFVPDGFTLGLTLVPEALASEGPGFFGEAVFPHDGTHIFLQDETGPFVAFVSLAPEGPMPRFKMRRLEGPTRVFEFRGSDDSPIRLSLSVDHRKQIAEIARAMTRVTR